MMDILQMHLQEVFLTLNNDSNLQNLVDGVYSDIPQDTQFPYILIKQSRVESANNTQNKGYEITYQISVFLQSKSAKNTLKIVEKISEILANKQLTISNTTCLPIKYKYHDLEKQNDGVTMLVKMIFTTYLYID